MNCTTDQASDDSRANQ